MRTLAGLLAVVAAVVPAAAGPWIAPDWPGGKEPTFPARPYRGENNTPNRCVVYRKVVAVPASYSYACIRLATDDYAFVFVDDKEVFAHSPVTSSPGKVLDVDLTEHLSPGKRVLSISAPAGGFAMAGWLVHKDGATTPLDTDATWKAQKLPPALVLELEPFVKPAFDDADWSAVKTPMDRTLELPMPDLVKTFFLSRRDYNARLYDDSIWRLEMLAAGSIAVVEGPAGVWEAQYAPTPGWCNGAAQAAARNALAQAGPTARLLQQLQAVAKDQAEFAQQPGWLIGRAEGQVARLAAAANAACRLAALDWETTNLALQLDTMQADADSDPESEPSGSGDSDEADEPAEESGDERIEALRESVKAIEKSVAAGKWDQAEAALTAAERSAAAIRLDLEKFWGHPLNRLGVSRFSKLGWTPDSALVDGELADWGVHVNPPTTPVVLSLDGEWLFWPDPKSEGLAQGWQAVGLANENQWTRLRVPGNWDRSPAPEHKDFRGTAWYRTSLVVPEEWRTGDVLLHVQRIDGLADIYFNGETIGRTTDNAEQPTFYLVPRTRIHFGERNVIAIRLLSGAAAGGGLGSVQLRCSARVGPADREPPDLVDVLRSYLSPGILLKPRSRRLTFRGWAQRQVPGPTALLYSGENGLVRLPVSNGPVFDPTVSEKMKENWLLLEMGNQQRLKTRPDNATAEQGEKGRTTEGDRGREKLFDPQSAIRNPKSEIDLDIGRPILLVLQAPPTRIAAQVENGGVGQLDIEFAQAGRTVLAVRPFATDLPARPDELLRTCRLWSRLLLDYPIAHAELTRRNRGRVEVTDVYEYVSTRDAWSTTPIRLAPAPVLFQYAVASKVPDTAADTPLWNTHLPLGKYGNYAGSEGGVFRYHYRADPIPRLAGFTSRAFAEDDVGVPGNDRECQAISDTGANSYRAQFNFAAPKAAAFADACAAHRLCFLHNPDNTLGGAAGKDGANIDAWVQHYKNLAALFAARPKYAVAYDLINEPANMEAEDYNNLVAQIIAAIRRTDKRHLVYVETPRNSAAVEQFAKLALTGDPLTVYSFHDDRFGLRGGDRWPTDSQDIRNLYRHWRPAFEFAVAHDVPIHLGEFGGYEQGGEFSSAAATLLADHFRVFDQFNMHFHYASGRDIALFRPDGSLRESQVPRAFRRYFAAGYFNRFAEKVPGP